jgi:hypothetical protein
MNEARNEHLKREFFMLESPFLEYAYCASCAPNALHNPLAATTTLDLKTRQRATSRVDTVVGLPLILTDWLERIETI